MKSLALSSIFTLFSLFVVEIGILLFANSFILKILLSVLFLIFVMFNKSIFFRITKIFIQIKNCNKRRIKKKIVRYLRENDDFVSTGKSLSKTFYFSNCFRLLLIGISVAIFGHLPLVLNSGTSVYMFFFMLTLSIILDSAFNVRKLIIFSICCILFVLSPYILFLLTQDPAMLEIAKITFAYNGFNIMAILPGYILVSILTRATLNTVFKLLKIRLFK